MECWLKGGLVGLGYAAYCIVILAITDHLGNIETGFAKFLLIIFIVLSITALPYIALKAGFTPLLNLVGLEGEWACRIICGGIMIILFGFFAWMFKKARGNSSKNSILKKVNNSISNHFT
jgi:hypothetical protein